MAQLIKCFSGKHSGMSSIPRTHPFKKKPKVWQCILVIPVSVGETETSKLSGNSLASLVRLRSRKSYLNKVGCFGGAQRIKVFAAKSDVLSVVQALGST